MGRRKSLFPEEVRAAIRVRHYSYRTEQTYLDRIRRFILFSGKRHPGEMGESEVGEYLIHLAVERQVAPATQNQALNALVFLYRHVLDRPLDLIDGVVRAKRRERLPVVLTRDEIQRVLSNLDGDHWLVACLLYGSGLRLMVCMRLRVKDLDLSHRAIYVRDGKGGKDRVVTLPEDLLLPLRRQLVKVRGVHEKDLAVCLSRLETIDGPPLR